MQMNLVAKNGTVVHAPSTTDRNPVLCSNMRRASGYETIEAKFAYTDAPVTCKNCCRKLGIEAPASRPARKVAKPVKPAPTATDVQARLEASRASMIEWAEAMAKFDGGTAMDQMHAAAQRLYGFTKAGKAEARRAARKR
jgi:hypothetical protein